MIEVALAGGIGQGQGNQERGGGDVVCAMSSHESWRTPGHEPRLVNHAVIRLALPSVCDLTMDSAFVAPERYVKLMVYLCRTVPNRQQSVALTVFVANRKIRNI